VFFALCARNALDEHASSHTAAVNDAYKSHDRYATPRPQTLEALQSAAGLGHLFALEAAGYVVIERYDRRTQLTRFLPFSVNLSLALVFACVAVGGGASHATVNFVGLAAFAALWYAEFRLSNGRLRPRRLLYAAVAAMAFGSVVAAGGGIVGGSFAVTFGAVVAGLLSCGCLAAGLCLLRLLSFEYSVLSLLYYHAAFSAPLLLLCGLLTGEGPGLFSLARLLSSRPASFAFILFSTGAGFAVDYALFLNVNVHSPALALVALHT
jgi:hypothetical protein